MTINFQYWSMQFLRVGEEPGRECGIVMDDSDLDACFHALVSGRGDVAVRLSAGGGRRLVEYLKSAYIFVRAAGGVVENAAGQRLLMVRNGRADLPKGKVEDGETLLQAALRETAEETGLDRICPGPLLTKTYHIYDLYGGWHLKQTAWFRMRQVEFQPFVPQLEEGVTEGRWLSPEQWGSQLEQSYATMRVVVKKSAENVPVALNG